MKKNDKLIYGIVTIFIFIFSLIISLDKIYLYINQDKFIIVSCDNLIEGDTLVLNNFLWDYWYNWDIDYWCNLREIKPWYSKNMENTMSGKIIPKEIWKLSNLKYIDLSNKWLIGDIPIELSSLLNLQTLLLNENSLNWNIDFLNWMNNLKFLNLSRNKLSFDIWKFNFELKNLISLNLSFNQIYWTLPNTILNCKKIESIFLKYNNIDSNISEDILNIKSIKYIDLK